MNQSHIIRKLTTDDKMSVKEDMFDLHNDQYIEEPWTIIESYFKGQHLDRLVRHQLESYNNFVGYQIIKTIEMFNPVHIASDQDYDVKSGKHALEIFITFENFHMYRPQIHENNGATSLMFPQLARLRNFTYASSMTVDINIKFVVRNGESLENTQTFYKTLPKIHIGKMPIMIKSSICVLTQYKHVSENKTGECKFDTGGYFIINGSEKTVLGQERAAENRVYCFNIAKNSTKYTWNAEVKSVPDFKCISPKQINLYLSSKNNGFGNPIYVQLPRVKQPIPLFIVFRALGVISDEDICKKIILNINIEKYKEVLQGLQASIIDANTHLTQEDCIRFITTYAMYTPINMDKETGIKKKHEFTLDILNNDLFPHCSTRIQKIMFLGYMTYRLLEASFEWVKQDDRDSYINKRIDLTGTLLNNLFRNYFNKLVKDMEKQIIKEINTGSWKSTDDYQRIINETNIYKIIKSTTIENGIKRALSTGDFGIKHVSSNKVGVAQVLNRLTYVASLSHARRISTPTDKSGKLIPPRKLHSTTWGFLCPAECFDPETPILMWDGSSKRAGDIVVGDVLVDDLGNPTKVRTTCSGEKNMYDVIPDKDNFMKHRVTDNHILTLRIRQHKCIRKSEKTNRKIKYVVEFLNRNELKFQTKYFNSLKESEDFVNSFDDDDTLDITIENYLKLNKTTKERLVLFKVEGIHWTKKEVEMDPYLLGMWLGDGVDDGSGFALNYKTDHETLAYWKKWAQENGAIITKGERYNFSVCSKKNKDTSLAGLCSRLEETPLKKYLRKYNLLKNKHIPNEYLTNDRDTRLKVLAGLIDTDGSVRAEGHEIRICQGPDNYKIIEDAHTLAISLGFSCGVKEGRSQWTDEKKFSTYKELTITGHKICEIPTLLPRKKLLAIENKTQLLRSKSFMSSKFNLVETGIGAFVGWQLHDKRGRFCLKDGTSLHNTPEGQSVGVVKNLSYMTHVTIHSNSMPIYEYIMPHIIDISNLLPEEMYEKTKVFINGAWVGISNNPLDLYNMLKDKKQRGIINIYTSIVFDYKRNEIRVCNDAGRISRPLLRVKDNNILVKKSIIKELNSGILTWDDLLTNCKIDESIIEYIDPEEQSWSLIAVKPQDLIDKTNGINIYRYTHCEIHPSTIFGILASCIPFPEHNQSPRNTYQSAQAKQAMGVYMTNYQERMDKTAYVLNYPARPMVDTRVMDMIQINKIPSGSNVIVAIMTHTGYNQEDSLLFNKGSIDRGLFQATIYHTEKDEDKQKINGDEEIRCKPDPVKTKGMKFANYTKVTSKGLIPENVLVENRDVIISKVTPIRENRNDHTKVIKYEDQSRIYRTDEPTYIDKNYIDRNGDGYNFAKVRLRAVRKPVIGDKFSSRSGQKGTIGNIIPEEDMPFTSSGIRPDLILNPHAIPSRMTIAQLKETLMGKVLIDLGLFGDGTSFGELDISVVREELLKLGYKSTGDEIMYNGLTGEQIECNIFIGPVFYQRLKHMVTDKQHSRSIGPMVNLTRQPAEGRSRDGGLRFGEMERDCHHFATKISLQCGLAVEIGTMEKCGYKVLGFSEKENTIIPANQTAFMCKGERECLQITFEDGKTKTCTPEHPVLNSKNEWIKAKDLIIGETRVKNSVNYPLMKIGREIEECNGWSLNMEGLSLTTDNEENYLRTLAFSRILGYLVCDGHISKDNYFNSSIFFGNIIDMNAALKDLEMFFEIKQTNFTHPSGYIVNLSGELVKVICSLKGILRGRKVNQSAELPEFILDENCPRPIVREFLGGLFGADGHTCILGMHRGKRDILTSIEFSQSKTLEHIESLDTFMVNLKKLLNKCGIEKITVQNLKQTTNSKKNPDKTKVLQSTLHLDIDELVPFSEKIGFRYCCHKSQRLEAGVSYKRLRNEVVRQHNWLVARVDEITNFTAIKKENPNKNVPTKKAILQAVQELKEKEALVHEYAIPSTHDITDHLIKGTSFGKFTSKSFPTAEEYLEKIDAISWFIEEPINVVDSDSEDGIVKKVYGVNINSKGLPTMNLKVIDVRPAGVHKVYDIEVDEVHSFLANGAVAHNCMISHGASRFTRGRMYDASDKYQVYTCKKCGLIAAYNDNVHIHRCRTCDNRTDFAYVEIPYACKLLFQELITMNIAPRVITEN
jgi:DNA-directed RNA polymerase beta subunit/intein/homing endonuclease